MKPSIQLYLGLLVVLGLLVPQIAFSAGTPAGTVISNYATMSYKDLSGGSFPAFNSNTVTVTVARLAGIDLTPVADAKTVGDSLYVYWPFKVTNTGNSTDTLGLVVKFNDQTWPVTFFKDVNRDGILQPGENTAITFTDSLQADSSEWVIARFFVPYPTLSGTKDSLVVKTFSYLSNDTLRLGSYVTTISTGVVALQKTVSPSSAKPGSVISYRIKYTNNGTGYADTVIVTDKLDPNYTLVNGSFSYSHGDSVKLLTGGSYGPRGTVSWWIGNLSTGATGTLDFQVKIDSPYVPINTTIDNRAVVNWIDSTNNHQRKDSTDAPHVTILKLVEGTVGPDTTLHKIQDVSLNVVYGMVIHNTGNATDSLAVVSDPAHGSLGTLDWVYYVDADSNGVLDAGDYIFPGVNVTPPIKMDSTLYILAVALIPHNTPDKKLDTTSFFFSYQGDPTVKDTVKAITTVRAPMLSLVKTGPVWVSGPVDSLFTPNAIMEYTLTYKDTGTGAATAVTVVDTIPYNWVNGALWKTIYQPNSVKVNGVLQGDGSGDGDYTVADADVIVVTIPSVAADESGVIKYRVKIR